MKKPHENRSYENAILYGMNRLHAEYANGRAVYQGKRVSMNVDQPMYGGTVPAAKVKERRAKASRAKQARKINRKGRKG